jgi:hypothetical protein
VLSHGEQEQGVEASPPGNPMGSEAFGVGERKALFGML